MVLVATQVKRRRGTTAENDAFTGAEGEITVDLTKKTLRIHDGSTQGGTELAKSSDIYTQAEIDDLLSGKSSTDLSNITATGKETIAHNAMPSDTFVELTLGASGTTYTAPADGWFISRQEYNNGYYQVDIVGKSIVQTNTSQTQMTFMVPVRKGQVIKYSYSNLVPTDYGYFGFLYAQGAQ